MKYGVKRGFKKKKKKGDRPTRTGHVAQFWASLFFSPAASHLPYVLLSFLSFSPFLLSFLPMEIDDPPCCDQRKTTHVALPWRASSLAARRRMMWPHGSVWWRQALSFSAVVRLVPAASSADVDGFGILMSFWASWHQVCRVLSLEKLARFSMQSKLYN